MPARQLEADPRLSSFVTVHTILFCSLFGFRFFLSVRLTFLVSSLTKQSFRDQTENLVSHPKKKNPTKRERLCRLLLLFVRVVLI